MADAQANTHASKEPSLWEDDLPWVERADTHEHGAGDEAAWSLDSTGYVPAASEVPDPERKTGEASLSADQYIPVVGQEAISPHFAPTSPLTATEAELDVVGPGQQRQRRGRRLPVGVAIASTVAVVAVAGVVLGQRHDGHPDAASTVDTVTVSAARVVPSLTTTRRRLCRPRLLRPPPPTAGPATRERRRRHPQARHRGHRPAPQGRLPDRLFRR